MCTMYMHPCKDVRMIFWYFAVNCHFWWTYFCYWILAYKQGWIPDSIIWKYQQYSCCICNIKPAARQAKSKGHQRRYNLELNSFFMTKLYNVHSVLILHWKYNVWRTRRKQKPMNLWIIENGCLKILVAPIVSDEIQYVLCRINHHHSMVLSWVFCTVIQNPL